MTKLNILSSGIILSWFITESKVKGWPLKQNVFPLPVDQRFLNQKNLTLCVSPIRSYIPKVAPNGTSFSLGGQCHKWA